MAEVAHFSGVISLLDARAEPANRRRCISLASVTLCCTFSDFFSSRVVSQFFIIDMRHFYEDVYSVRKGPLMRF